MNQKTLKKIFSTLSIKTKILLVINVVSFVFLLILGYLLVQKYSNDLHSSLDKKLTSMMSLTTRTSSFLLFQVQLEALNKLAKDIVEYDDDIVTIRFKDDTGKFVTDEIPLVPGKIIYIRQKIYTMDEEKEFLGELICGYTLEATQIKVRETALFLSVFIIILQSILSVVLVLFVRYLLEPVTDLVNAAQGIIKGNLNIEITKKNSDELGILADAFINMRDSISQKLSQLTRENQRRKTAEIQRQKIFDKIKYLSECVRVNSSTINSSSERIKKDVHEQKVKIEELTSYSKMIKSSSNSNMTNAMEMDTLATETMELLKNGQKMVQETSLAIMEIETSSSEVFKILKSIDEISFKSNLLSLNSSVEAARAGVHGKGFAIVAGEMRSLSGKVGGYSVQSQNIIDISSKKNKQGSENAKKTSEALGHIFESMEKLMRLISKIVSLSKEQNEQIQNIDANLDSFKGKITSNMNYVEKNTESVKDLNEKVKQLKKAI